MVAAPGWRAACARQLPQSCWAAACTAGMSRTCGSRETASRTDATAACELRCRRWCRATRISAWSSWDVPHTYMLRSSLCSCRDITHARRCQRPAYTALLLATNQEALHLRAGLAHTDNSSEGPPYASSKGSSPLSRRTTRCCAFPAQHTAKATPSAHLHLLQAHGCCPPLQCSQALLPGSASLPRQAQRDQHVPQLQGCNAWALARPLQPGQASVDLHSIQALVS